MLCCFNSVPGALSHSILCFSLRLLRCLRGSLREHDCAISTIDPPKLHFENFNVGYPLDLLCCEKYKCYFQIFTMRLSLFNKYKIYGTTYEYIYTYIHTYIQTPFAFNTLMWGSLRLALISRGMQCIVGQA